MHTKNIVVCARMFNIESNASTEFTHFGDFVSIYACGFNILQ